MHVEYQNNLSAFPNFVAGKSVTGSSRKRSGFSRSTACSSIKLRRKRTCHSGAVFKQVQESHFWIKTRIPRICRRYTGFGVAQIFRSLVQKSPFVFRRRNKAVSTIPVAGQPAENDLIEFSETGLLFSRAEFCLNLAGMTLANGRGTLGPICP